MTIRLPLPAPGHPPVTNIVVGGHPLVAVRVGGNLVWSRGTIYDSFDGPDGFLISWVNEMATGDLGDLVSDGLGFLIDGLGNVVGSVVALVEGGVNGLGELVSTTSTSLVDAYCGVWGGTSPPGGLVGLINGIPVFGSLIGGVLGEWLEGDLNIESIIGKIPVFGKLAETIGLIPDQVGNLLDPINYVVDAAGTVLGTLTCGRFTLHGGSDEDIAYVIGRTEGTARMMIPDGLMNLDKRTSRFRHPTLCAADNGYVEVQVAALGSSGMKTQVFHNYSNNGSRANGVGMELVDSTVSIVRRVGGVETVVKPNLTSMAPFDRLRLTRNGDLHTLTRNGAPAGEWNDLTSTAAEGAANRSVAMVMQGAKERAGTRLFSPSLNYLEAA
jgi:hypothetical protein